jgi:hypothetical protein
MALKEPHDTKQYETHRHGHNMNIRFFAYGIAALLIGFSVMMLPLALETGPPTYQPKFAGETTGEQSDQLRSQYGLTSPSDVTSSSLILFTGLIIAFAAYLLVKKQVNPPPTFSNSYKPF